jgi:antirestriction protein ArdC
MRSHFNSHGDGGRRTPAHHIANQMISMFEKGVRPWMLPWETQDGTRILRPLRNNGIPYSGVNVLTLWASAHHNGFANPYFMTALQADAAGGHARDKELKAATWACHTATRAVKEINDDGEEEVVRQIRYVHAYKVYNAQQIDNLPDHYYDPRPTRLDPDERIARAEEFIAATGADIRYGRDKAFYSIRHDFIGMPDFEAFKDKESAYGTLLHEATHWTGHPTRLARRFGRGFGDEAYAREELVAEIGSVILCSELDITPEPREENAAYFGDWAKILKKDPLAIFEASRHGQHAADFLISAGGTTYETIRLLQDTAATAAVVKL